MRRKLTIVEVIAILVGLFSLGLVYVIPGGTKVTIDKTSKHEQKTAPVSTSTITVTQKNSTTTITQRFSTTTNTIIVKEKVTCTRPDFFEIHLSQNYMEKCNNSNNYYQIYPWEFIKDGIKKSYGMVMYNFYACDCPKSVGYFSFDDTDIENEKLIIASSSIIEYKNLKSETSLQGGSVFYFDTFPSLVFLSENNIYLINPNTKVVSKIYTLIGSEYFGEQSTNNQKVEYLDATSLRVKVYKNKTTTDSEMRTIAIPK